MIKEPDLDRQSIEDYFKIAKKEQFVIPQYQRKYSWEKEQCETLLQDIDDYLKDRKDDDYFFGTIIIDNKKASKLCIIDGQQRTITFILLLKALLLNINKVINELEYKKHNEIYKNLKSRRKEIIEKLYKIKQGTIDDIPNKNDLKIYRKFKLIKSESIDDERKDDLEYILKSESFEEAENNVSKIFRKKKENKFSNYFKNFKLFYEKFQKTDNTSLNAFVEGLLEWCKVIVIKCCNMEQAISVFNSLNSKGMPLTDSDIIRSYLYSVAIQKGKKDDFEKEWGILKEEIEKLEKNEICDLDSLLMQLMYYERAVNGETGKDGTNVTTPGLRKYFIYKKAKIMNDPLDFCQKLIHIAKMWNDIYRYSITKVLLRFNKNFKLFLGSYFFRFNNASNISEIKMEQIILSFLKLFTILELVDKPYSSNEFKTFLFKQQKNLISDNKTESKIYGEFINHIRNSWQNEKTVIMERLLNIDNNVFVFLNEYLISKEKNKELFIPEVYDIEHIMPKSGKNIDTIRKDAGIEDKKEFESIVDKIGNKMILERNINRSIGNNWFTNKKENYKSKSKCIRAEAIAKDYKNNRLWTVENIEKETKKAASRIIKFLFDE